MVWCGVVRCGAVLCCVLFYCGVVLCCSLLCSAGGVVLCCVVLCCVPPVVLCCVVCCVLLTFTYFNLTWPKQIWYKIRSEFYSIVALPKNSERML